MSAIKTLSGWARLIGGLAAVLALFHWSAIALGSDRGQAGIAVALLVVAATFAVERVAFGTSIASASRSLGFGRPEGAAIAASGLVSCLLLVVPVLVHASGTRVAFLPGSLLLVPGLFAQGGVAEEVLFRGYLFGRLRRTRSFWRAAWLSMIPFVFVHLILFFTMEWPIALAAVGLAVVTSFPLAQLYELGGRTIWAPALLHFVVQAAIKVLVLTGPAAAAFPLVWMAACAIVPLLVLFVPRPAEGHRLYASSGTRTRAPRSSTPRL